MWKEFKEFAMKGNVIDLAVGVIIGGAFGKIVTSLVNDVVMPLLGLILGKIDFSNLFITLGSGHYKTIAEAQKAGVPTLNYGIFINNVVDFLIVAICVFLVIRQMNKVSKKLEKPKKAAEATTKKCKYCFTEIPVEATRCPHCTSEL